jgi:hypothetical protein
MTEHPLGGGNVAAGVVRVGDTVRKPAGFWTPAVEALLAHLWRAGFTGAPRPLGRDDRGGRCSSTCPGRWRWTSRGWMRPGCTGWGG